MGDVARVNRGEGLYAKAGFLSRFTFSWLTPVVKKARKGESIADDISHPEHLDADKACREFTLHWEQEKKNKNPSLIRAIRSCYKQDFIKAVIVKLCWSACLLMAAFYFVRRLVTIVSDASKGIEDRGTEGWILACFFFVCCALLSFAQQQMLRITQDTGVKLRAALTTAIYRKALKLERAAEESTVVLNLATNDCQRLMEACTALHALWSSPMEALTIVILLIVLIGVWGLVALGLVVFLLVAQVWAAQRVSYLRGKTIAATDSRVRVMAELLAAIKLVKLYAWEDSFLDEVRKLRKKETKYIRKGNVYKSWNLMSVFALPPIIAVVLFSLYQWDEGKLPSTIAFTTLSLFNTLRFPLVILPKAIKNLAEARAAVRRVQAMLLEPEIVPVERRAEPGALTFNDVGIGYLKPADAIAPAHTVKVLHHIFFEVAHGEKAALVSAVGGGKTSVLLAALGEARVLRGHVEAKGRIAYVPQNPWIFAGTMRSNIVFGRPFDQERYDIVVKACALEDDFRIASHGDATMVAERGINLSGGQRQRLSIARAVYGDADLFLFDNPLSAVDWHTSQHIMTHCVEGLLKSKTVLMATHQIHLLERFQRVVVLKDRTVVYQGPYDLHELRLQMPEYFQEEDHSSPVKQRRKQPSTVPTITEHEGEAEAAAANKASASTKEQHEHKHSEQPAEASKPLPQQQPAVKEELQAQPTSVTQMLSLLNPDQRPVSAVRAYLRTGGYLVVSLSAFSFVFTQTNRIMSDWWISQWTGDTKHLSKMTYNYIYLGLVIGFIVNLLIRGITFYRVVIRIGTRMHNLFYGRVLKAPLAFFSVMPLGDLLNTFSRDQDTIDETLPDVMHLTFIYLLILLTTITLVCVVLPPYVAVGGSLFVFTVFVVKYYIKAGLFLRKLANETAAPVFSQLSESLRGIVVVRAFGLSAAMERLNAALLDYHHDAVFHLNQLSLWLAFRLDLMGATLVGATALLSVAERNEMSDAITGLAISNSLQALVFFTWMARGLSDVAALFSSVDRMESLTVNLPQEQDPHAPKSDQSSKPGSKPAYSKIAEIDQPAEKPLEMVVVDTQSPKHKAKWPTEGVIQFNDVYIRYLPWLPPALRGLDFSVRPREKIGVVGRTGAGKSSLIMAIYRMFPIERGTITIDGRDLGEMSLQELRSSLSIIPQEPVMFHGTIRSNLDPFKRCTDSELWTALEIAHMKDTVMNLRLQLESPVEDEGENFSVGQRQLVCLARAFLARSPILFLDEATAAMDLVTDALIQATIREHFADRTIITIAHRIDTVIHSDRILVMDAGRMAELDTPRNLLSNPNSSFSRLVSSGGKNYFDSIVRLMNNPPAKAAPIPKEDSFASTGGKIPLHPNMSHTEFRSHSHAHLQLPDPDQDANNGSPLTKPAATGADLPPIVNPDRREVMSVEVDL